MSRHKKITIAMLVLLAGLIISDSLTDVSIGWYFFLLFVYGITCATGTFVMSSQFFLKATCHGNKTEKQIAITFDDGPVQGKTEQILDILHTCGVQATFFCIGSNIEKNKDLLMRIDKENHLVGNHSYSHKATFGFFSSTKVAHELSTTDDLIATILGKKPRFFRPPFGVTNPMIATASRNYQTIGWSIRSFDTIIKNSNRLFKRITTSIKPGDVILFHDYSLSTIEILPKFIHYVQNKGFQIVRLDELLNEKAYK